MKIYLNVVDLSMSVVSNSIYISSAELLRLALIWLENVEDILRNEDMDDEDESESEQQKCCQCLGDAE